MQRNVNVVMAENTGKFFISGEKGSPDEGLIGAFIADLTASGIKLSPDSFKLLLQYSSDAVVDCYLNIREVVRKRVFNWCHWHPMYLNFPNQVMEASMEKLISNAYAHYISDGQVLPQHEKIIREKLHPPQIMHTINIVDDEDVIVQTLRNLIEAKVSISTDQEKDLMILINWAMENERLCEALSNLTIPNRENAARFICLYIQLGGNPDDVAKYIKTPTDVLRVACALKGLNVSLCSSREKFPTFSRPQRRFILAALDRTYKRQSEMQKYRTLWLKLGERIHVGKYKKTFPNAVAGFDAIRNKKPQYENSFVEKMLDEGDVCAAAKYLVEDKRAGELARRLDYLLRSSERKSELLNIFKEGVDEISTNLLIQVLGHFQKRRPDGEGVRSFTPKGPATAMKVISESLPFLSEEILREVCDICKESLASRFKKLEPMGKVYIDPALKDYLVPSVLRNTSRAVRTVSRGSCMPIPEGVKVVRGFMFWRNEEYDRVDLDLSANLFIDDYHSTIYFRNLRTEFGCHSGDIVDAPNGAAEFVDVDLEKARNSGVKYIAFTVNSYTSQSFDSIPEAYSGVMFRDTVDTGEVFEPATVAHRYDLTSQGNNVLTLFIDVPNNKMYFADSIIKARIIGQRTAVSNADATRLIIDAIKEKQSMSIYELLALHAKARGELTDRREDADVCFGVDEGTHMDLEMLAAKYM